MLAHCCSHRARLHATSGLGAAIDREQLSQLHHERLVYNRDGINQSITGIQVQNVRDGGDKNLHVLRVAQHTLYSG